MAVGPEISPRRFEEHEGGRVRTGLRASCSSSASWLIIAVIEGWSDELPSAELWPLKLDSRRFRDVGIGTRIARPSDWVVPNWRSRMGGLEAFSSSADHRMRFVGRKVPPILSEAGVRMDG